MNGKHSWQLDLIDDHVRGLIDDEGFHFISDRRLGRRVRPERCPRCMRFTLVALDADRCALTARVDPYPLNPLGEVRVLQAGRSTYRLISGELQRRDRWNIPGSPPSHAVVVLPEHGCAGIPADWRKPPAPPKSKSKEVIF